MDIGENIVGAYLRQVRHCESIMYNTHISHQAEIDVIGVRASDPVQVWIAEVAVHLGGLEYGKGYEHSVRTVTKKIASARQYAAHVYKDAELTLEFWSPIVPKGLLEPLESCGAELVVNEGFTQRVSELVSAARMSTSLTGDDAFRFLQILTHLRGGSTITLGGSESAARRGSTAVREHI